MSKLYINCDEDIINKEQLADAVYTTLKQKVNLTAEISFCSQEEIRKINNEQRHVDAVTDVLSFPAAEVTAGEIIKRRNYPFDIEPEHNGVFLGCIIICTDRAKEQAEEFGHSFEREIYYLAVHGLMHLFGYDHMNEDDKEVMRANEELVLTKLGKLR